MIIDALRNYIRKCHLLEEFNEAIKVGVDYLSPDATTYSIEAIPSQPILKKYLDGSSKRQYEFMFTSRESYGADVLQNINNSAFYENFSEWLEEESIKGNLPILGENKEAIKVEATTTGYPIETDVDKARYVIQCRLIYMQGGIK